MSKTWSIIAHGGAKAISRDAEEAHRRGIAAALAVGAEILKQEGTALSAVVQTVRALENDRTFNAAKGAARRNNGDVEMDASLMCGRSLDIGAVAGIRDVESPILVAAQVLSDKPILMVGPYATDYARKKGFAFYKQNSIDCDSEDAHDTVGCVARDLEGNYAVGVSTGGLAGSDCGRVGDAALPGCGFYADNTRGGSCVSGEGETIARIMLTGEVMNGLRTLPAEEAIARSLEFLKRVNGEAGCILLDAQGRPAWNHNSKDFVVAYQTESDFLPHVFLRKSEEAR